MAEKKPINIKEVIAEGTVSASLKDLEKRGFQRVKVLDERAIQNLISRAIDRIVVTETSEEKQRILARSREELDSLLREHSSTVWEERPAGELSDEQRARLRALGYTD